MGSDPDIQRFSRWSRLALLAAACAAPWCALAACTGGSGAGLFDPDASAVVEGGPLGVPDASGGGSLGDVDAGGDANGGPDGAGPNDAGDDGAAASQAACLAVCPAAGGACLAGKCTFDCSAPSSCATGVTCPKGVPCAVGCSGQGSCAGKVDCDQASSCRITCGAHQACAGDISCKGTSCDVTCLDLACTGAIDCVSGSCTVSCGGVDSCTGGVNVTGSVSQVNCTGSGSCSGQPTCAGSVCTMNCNALACADEVCCTAQRCNYQQSATDACL